MADVGGGWWGEILRLSSPGFIVLECLSSLVAQQLKRVGKNLAWLVYRLRDVAPAMPIVWVLGSRLQ